MHAGRMNVAGIFLVGRDLMFAEHFGLHHFGETENGVEWRAQFVAHLRQEARLGNIGGLGALACFVGNHLGLFEFADQRVFFGARFQRRQGRRIEPIGENGEVTLRRHRHDGENVIAQVTLQREVERDRRRHREGRGEGRDRQG